MSGRIRSIKPEILEDEECAALSDEAWRMWVSLWCLADDHGNVRAGDRYLAAQVWQDTARSPRVAAILRELQRAHRVEIYIYGERCDRYLHVRNWEKHQRLDNAGKPKVPGPSDAGATRIRILADGSAEILGEPPPPSEILGSRAHALVQPLEGKGNGREMEGKGEESGAPPPAAETATRPSPDRDAIREELAKHPCLRVLPSATAATLDGIRVSMLLPLDVVLASIRECAEKSEGLGLNSEATLSKVVAFVKRRPRTNMGRGGPIQPSTGKIFKPAIVI